MKIIKSLTFCLLSFVLAISCGPKDREFAVALLKSAESDMAVANYNGAKLKVDSINLLYPEEIELIAEGNRMLNVIELNEQEQSLSYYDTLLVKRQKEFDVLVKSFVYKKGKFEGYAGTYIHKRQKVANSHDRTYIKAYLDEKGEFYISSRFHGKSHIYHDRIKVYNDGLFAETQSIDKSSFDNRTFDDGEDYWETVNYRNGTDDGVVSFIVNNFDKPLKVQFKGKQHHFIVMESFDKEAVRDAYNLSLVIKELSELKKNKTQTEKRISDLNRIIAASQPISE